jgi:hypothetical protein
MYHMQEKYAKLKQGEPNPFIDPARYKIEMDIDEAMFRAVLDQQQKASGAAQGSDCTLERNQVRRFSDSTIRSQYVSDPGVLPCVFRGGFFKRIAIFHPLNIRGESYSQR